MSENKESSAYSWLALGIVVIGTFMSILDSTIVNIALPKMMAVFGIDLNTVKWIITAYSLALGAIIPLTGYFQEIFSQKKIYLSALAIFTAGSLLCGLSWNHSSMIFFRIIQALGGGMLMPVGMAILYSVFPREKIGMALGFWGIAAMAAPAVGPTLGGYIIQTLDWRLIFYINVPIGVMGVLLGMIVLKGAPNKPLKPFDVIGFLSSTAGIVCVLYVMGESSQIDWSKLENQILMTIGVLSLIIFVINELTYEHPLLDLRVFKFFDFTLGQIISSILTFALMGGAYLLPLFLQNIRGCSAMQAGILMFPSAVVVGIMMPISGNLFDRFGAKPIAVPGLIILAVSSFQLAWDINMNSSYESIILVTCIRSVGLGLTMSSINSMSMNPIPKHLIGMASAVSSMTRQIVSAVSVTLLTSMIQARFEMNYQFLSSQVNLFSKAALDTVSKLTSIYMTTGMDGKQARGMAISKLTQIVSGQAYVDALAYAVEFTALIVLITIVLSFFIRKNKIIKEHKGEDTNAGGEGFIFAE